MVSRLPWEQKIVGSNPPIPTRFMKRDKVLDELDKILTDGYIGLKAKRDPEGSTRSHLRWMIKEMKTKKFSSAKWNRWLGYIQGVMVVYDLTNLDAERERNR